MTQFINHFRMKQLNTFYNEEEKFSMSVKRNKKINIEEFD